MKKLKNGWMHKKSYVKSLVWTSLVLVIFIAYCTYLALAKDSNVLNIVLFAILGFMVSSMVYMFFYSKEIREFSEEVNKVYASMDPKSFYDYIDSLDGAILADETLCKIAFFMAWFKHFEGKDEEAKELFNKYDTNPFPYPTMYSLKTLIKVYLLDNKEDGYKVVEEDLKAVEALNLKPKLKQQLVSEISATNIRIDAFLGKASNDLIEALKQDMSAFENAQNRTLLVSLTKDSDPGLALAAKNYVLKNSGAFVAFVNEVKDVYIDESLIPEAPSEEETNELTNSEETSNEEVVNEEKQEINEVKEEVVDEPKATISLDEDDKKDAE